MELKQKLDALIADNTLATEEQHQKHQAMVKAMREEFKQLKKKVAIDTYYGLKAAVAVYGNELEKLIIQASIHCLDAESRALEKCFNLQVPSLQFHIHPFQHFAATHFDSVDPNQSQDIINRVGCIQELLTRCRNRATEVETLTSGPGLVLTVKDFNEILLDFCRSYLTSQHQATKSLTETHQLQLAHYQSLLYCKNRKIENMQQRFDTIALNLDSIIASRMFEKGN